MRIIVVQYLMPLFHMKRDRTWNIFWTLGQNNLLKVKNTMSRPKIDNHSAVHTLKASKVQKHTETQQTAAHDGNLTSDEI